MSIRRIWRAPRCAADVVNLAIIAGALVLLLVVALVVAL